MLLGKAGRRITSILAIVASFVFVIPGATAATGDKDSILDVIKTYERALNKNDVDSILRLYSDNGVFMPSGKPSAVGQAQVRLAYEQVFKELDLDVAFHIDEVVVSGELAFVRTTSDGKIKLLAKDSIVTNNSRELFIMQKIGGKWRINRYMFNEAGLQKS